MENKGSEKKDESIIEEIKKEKISRLHLQGIIAFFQLLRNAYIHSLDNELVEKVLDIFISRINEVIKIEAQYSIQFSEGLFFVNKEKQRITSYEDLEKVQWLEKEFKKFNIGGITIFSHADRRETKLLLAALKSAPKGKQGILTIQMMLDKNDVIHIKLNKPLVQDESSKISELDTRFFVYLVYVKTLILTKEYITHTGRVFFARKLRRTVQSLVDACMENAHLVLGLSAVKNYSDFLPNHSVNVAVLSTALGHKIGLEKKDLGEVALCGLFHDMGMLHLMQKGGAPGTLDEKGEELGEHITHGVTDLLCTGQFNESVLKRIIVTYEHHIGYNLSGFPKPLSREKPYIFSRIVSIADGFDTLTTERAGKVAYLPDEALRIMMKESGRRYDPILLKVFVNLMGIYPLGTLVVLSTGEVGIVYQTTLSGEQLNRPIVLLLRDKFGNEIPGKIIDLTEKAEDGSYKRSILKSDNPKKYNINIPHYLFG